MGRSAAIFGLLIGCAALGAVGPAYPEHAPYPPAPPVRRAVHDRPQRKKNKRGKLPARKRR